MARLTVRDLSLSGKRVFIRVDFNVPIINGQITDEGRIIAALPTIRYALEQGASVILASHLGRPKGIGYQEDFSMAPVLGRLREIFGDKVKFSEDVIGENAENASAALAPGEILLLENLRFHPGEKKDDGEFAAALKKLADLYVNDAFGTCHRAHASVHALPSLFEHPAAGFLVEKEIHYFDEILKNPARPYVVVLGGAKVSDKIPVIQHLMGNVDRILIGGAMAYSFLKASGVNVGNSMVEEDRLEMAANLMEQAAELQLPMEFPQDHVAADSFDNPKEIIITAGEEIPDGYMGLDIGPETIVRYEGILAQAETVLWNGPMGVFEDERFAVGTLSVAETLAESDATSIIGGGDSAAAVRKAGLADGITHISTGGGASLAYMSGEKLPGIEILAQKGEEK
ncbi:MAG: phosphoglycerate kinase [Acidobacteria bacterium]|nr:phosphoglycerate kinase [Acidobacteriota bacterium]